MTPRVVVDNTIEMTKEKISDIFLITKEFHTSTEFSQFIEKMAFNSILHTDQEPVEIESIGKFLTSNLKAKIKEEALDLNLLKEKKKSKLPL